MLMVDTPALAPEFGYYQRLLARDQGEAADLIEQHIKTEAPRTVYDALLLPALNYAERDRLEQRLSLDEETAVIDATRELLSDAAELIRRLSRSHHRLMIRHFPDYGNRCACWDWRPTAWLTSLRWRCSGTCWTICQSSRSPRGACSPRNSCRWYKRKGSRLSASLICRPALRPRHAISSEAPRGVAGGANPGRTLETARAAADDSTQLLRDAGATLVASTLTETRTYLGGLVEIPRLPLPASGVQAA